MSFLFLLWLASPAFVANMIPVLFARFSWCSWLDFPIDGKKHFRGKRILGDHKTIRGFVAGTFFATIWGGILFFLTPFLFQVSFFSSWEMASLFGFLAGFGALFGDSFESFFKRQIGIASGRPFFPFDQVDYILGFFLFTLPFVPWNFVEMVFLLLFSLVLNPLVNALSYVCGIKKTFW